MRIPFIIAGGVPYEKRRFGPVDAPLSTVDILPTSLGLCGIPPPAEFPGYDYSHYVWRDQQAPRGDEPDSAYLQHTCRKRMDDGLDRAWRGVVTRDGWKYVCIPHAPWGLFNLNEDPFEMANLAFNHRFFDKRRELQERLAKWIDETGDGFDLPEL